MPGRRLVLAAVFTLVLAACWEQPGFDAGGSNASPWPVGVGVGNVGELSERFRAPAGPDAGVSSAVISAGRLFVIGARLRAYDASGIAGCSGPTPAQCDPIWVSQESSGFTAGPVVGGGKVWGVVGNRVVGYDVAGVTGCGGTPTTCAPVVTITPPVLRAGGLLWADGAIHVAGTTQVMTRFDETRFAYEPDGRERWRLTLGSSSATHGLGAAAGADHVYAAIRGIGVGAFDIRGRIGCSGTPVTCAPLWIYPVGSPVVKGDRLFLQTSSGISVFDARGVDGCSGSPKVCTARWKTSGPTGAIAISAEHLYVASDTGTAVYSLGQENCAGAPVVCSPLWSNRPTGDPYAATGISVAGGVVYTSTLSCLVAGCGAGTMVSRVDAHDASGVAGCSGAPSTCAPAWSHTFAPIVGAPMVVGDTVFVPGALQVGPLGAAPEVIAFRAT